MPLTIGSNYPDAFDTDDNLFLVHDSLRLKLSEDYNPGDTSITAYGDPTTMSRFTPTGIITLTEQCSDPDLRAISFYYGSIVTTTTTTATSTFTTATFSGLVLLPDFTDCVKPALITDITLNVMDLHHNNIKDALISIEDFVGKKGVVGTAPLQGTMEARINFLRKLVLVPKAWFSVDKNIGLVPLTVTFTDQSFRLGTDGTAGPISLIWNFGDNTSSIISYISLISSEDITQNNVIVTEVGGDSIMKTYTTPGVYDVSLTAVNAFGEDILVLPALISARIPAPDPAVITFVPTTQQDYTPGVPTNGPYTENPYIRSPVNTLINITINSGVNPNTGRSYAGEELNAHNAPIDPITAYSWNLSDDQGHPNSQNTKASFSVGGIYDLILRVDTEFGDYRITTYPQCLDIAEQTNLWLWNQTSPNTIQAYEMGLISETFKAVAPSYYNINTNSSFLNSVPNSSQQIREFNRNNGFTPTSGIPSGQQGVGLLYWASGRNASASASTENINFVSYNAFLQTYTSQPSISRPWNWLALNSGIATYFMFGAITGSILPNTSPTNQTITTLATAGLTYTNQTLGSGNYKNGADELQQNVATYTSGNSVYGNFSVYRTAWKGNSGYILRNNGVGTFFQIKSFYKTGGTTSSPVQYIQKLPDMPGPSKVEGELVALSGGLYFFNNSGSVSVYNDSTGTWQQGGPGINSVGWASLQDSSVSTYNSPTNTLLAASDGDHRAYLSFDYSTNVFIRFNESDLTFTSLPSRPAGNQWMMQIY